MELRCFPRYSTSIHHTAAVIRHVAQHEAAVESAFGESFIVCLFFIAFFELNDFKLFWLERSWCSAHDENFFRAIARRLSVHLSASQREKWRVGCYAILWRSAVVEIVTYNFSSSSEEKTHCGARESKSAFHFDGELSGFRSFTPAETFKNPSAFIAANLVRGSALWFAIIFLSPCVLKSYFAIN